MLSWRELLLSFDGEIDRKEFWQGVAVVSIFAVLAIWLAQKTADGYDPNMLVAIPAWIAGAWMVAAVGAKRCRDRGRPPWWVALLLVPMAGPFWYFIELGMLPSRAPAAGPDIVEKMLGQSGHSGPFLTPLGWAALGFLGFGLAALTVFITKVMGSEEAHHPENTAVLLVFSLFCAVPILWSRWRAVKSGP